MNYVRELALFLCFVYPRVIFYRKQMVFLSHLKHLGTERHVQDIYFLTNYILLSTYLLWEY